MSLTYGRPIDIEGDWTATVHAEGSRHELEVLLSGQQQYWCNISRATEVWLFEKGAATLAMEGLEHKALAKFVLDALDGRPRGTVMIGVTILHKGETINGKTYRTRMGSRNHFTDGTTRRLSGPYGRITMQCIGGTYLVSVMRHVDGNIFAVEVTVQQGYDKAKLEACLRHLA